MTVQRIVSDPKIMMGKPVVEGTRITVEAILEDLGSGEPIEQIVDAHPRLTREGVLAAVRFGAEAVYNVSTAPEPDTDFVNRAAQRTLSRVEW